MRFTIDVDALPADALRRLREIPAGIGDDRFFRASEWLNAYVDRLAHEHVAALDGEIARPAHRAWLLRKLERAGLAELDPWGRLARLSEPEEPADAVKELALARIPEMAPSFALFDAARAGYPDFLRGRCDGAAVLLAPSAVRIWQEYFDNRDFVYSANNRLAAHLAARACLDGGKLEVLEVGGGFGSAAEVVIPSLAPRLQRYRFTEPFPLFLAGARRRLARAAPGAPIEYAPLDLNQPLAAQGIAPESVDLVLAVNVLHVVRDLAAALREIAAALRPRGALVLVECVRPAPGVPIYVDYPFQMLEEFFRIDDAGPARPHGGFLSPRNWRDLLAAANLRLVDECPDHDFTDRWYPGLHVVGMTAVR